MTQKIFTLCFLFSLVLTACGSSAPQSSPEMDSEVSASSEATATTAEHSDLKRYGVESGMIEFELTGSQTGTKTIYWDHWGMREATYKNAEITAAGMTIPANEVTVMDGDWMYTYNPDDKTGTRLENPLLKEIAKGAGNDDLGEIGLAMLESMGAQKTGTRDVAGVSCDVYEVSQMGTTSCVWKAITLETNVGVAGMTITETATKIDVDSAVPEEKLLLPDDIEIKDLGNLKEIMKDL